VTTSEEIRDRFNYLFRDELVALKRYARALPPNPTIINIGAGSGTSGLAFLESRTDATVVTIDITNTDSPFGSLYSERAVVKNSGINTTGRWTQIHSDSKTAYWPNQVDMVFIDGDHSYEGCRGDIEVWLPRLRAGGLLLVHDYKKTEAIAMLQYDPKTMPHYKEWRGVDKAVDDLLETDTVAHVETVVTLAVMVKK
jgi:predicted O-methyltransferase YrrM